MKTNRYMLALEIKPEHVDDFRELHLNCMQGMFAGQPQAVLDSGILENMVFLYKNICIVYIETASSLEDVLTRLSQTQEYKLFAAREAPWILPAEPADKAYLEKIYDARQFVAGTFTEF